MRLSVLAMILFYTIILSFIGILIIGISFNLINFEYIKGYVEFIQESLNNRIIFTLIGFILILINFSFVQLITGKIQQAKTIAFNTPSGQVTVSLAAIEDLIRRMTKDTPEVKELRPEIIAGKKGIEISLKLILKSEANIPELTSRLQELIKEKVQEILGIEEEITVKVHVAKIALPEEKKKLKKETTQLEEELNIPFQGYGKS